MKYEIIKGSEKDFEGAPESATVRIVENGFQYDIPIFADALEKFSVRTHCYTGIYDTHIADASGWTVIAERRPITEPVVNQQLTTEWDADGFPVVGTECEAKYRDAANAEWLAFRCVGVDCGVAFGWAGNEAVVICKESYEFCPIRLPEDVARDEAKGIIAELCRSSASNGHSADLIYDAIAAGSIKGITKTPTVSELMRVTENATREDCEAIVKMLSGK